MAEIPELIPNAQELWPIRSVGVHPAIQPLTGLRWTVERRGFESNAALAEHLAAVSEGWFWRDRFAGRHPFLVACESFAQPPSAVRTRRRFWGQVDSPHEFKPSSVVEMDVSHDRDSVRWAAVSKIERSLYFAAIRYMQRVTSAFLVLGPDNRTLHQTEWATLLRSAFNVHNGVDWTALALQSPKLDILWARVSGGFDDPAFDLTLVGGSSTIEPLLSSTLGLSRE